ncbi:DUF4396 domain-containing protein [Bacillus tianshenii]|nr:DUF4396 domain-containing protein [Bacillus tianshenii]
MIHMIGYIAIGIGIVCSIIILFDILKHPQHMKIMNVVWPMQGLYLGPIAIWAYWRMGRQKGHEGHGHGDKPFWQSVFVSTSHCSSGCILGDVIGAPLVFITGLHLLGSKLFTDYSVEFTLAYIFGIFFQLFSIVPMSENLGWGKGVVKAIKADTLSLVAFEVGMFGWMTIVHFYIFPGGLKPIDIRFWFMMQIAMILGAATSYPANWFLVKRGIKHQM